jgi:hypothetical protein
LELCLHVKPRHRRGDHEEVDNEIDAATDPYVRGEFA